jgi:N-carbamoylputrescine amidase
MKKMNKKELLQRVGSVSQIGGIKDYTFNDGKSKGVRAIEVNTGVICFTVLVDRGLDIAQCFFKGEAVSWISKTDVVAPTFYEKDGNRLFNSVAVIDADGTLLGVYRKTHIPDDHYYQEKFYFIPGDTGFRVFSTKFAKTGVGICWDQWFPETARAFALNGAELLFYPTAIGSEPILETDSMPHWTRTMQGHAAANLMPVIAANRYGLEEVQPCTENGGQTSALRFYGSSFIADNTGALLCQSDREGDAVLTADFDLDALASDRLSWGIFRDRRPDRYGILTEK